MCVRGVGARLFFEADMWHQGCWSGGDTAAKRRGRAGKDGGEGLAELLRPPVMPIYPPEQGCCNNHSYSALQHRKEWTRPCIFYYR